MSHPRVRYGLWTEISKDWTERTRELAEPHDVTRVCDVGGGARPALPLRLVQASGLEYSVVDLSPTELAKAPKGYKKIVADATGPRFDLGPYDLVLTRSFGEHVRAPARLHADVLSVLRPGGRALHLFPTLYAPPFVFNRVVPDQLARRVLLRLSPERASEGRHGKFPAFYRWCRGPSRRQLRRFQSIGFEIEEYKGYFGHGYYDWIPGARPIEEKIARALCQRRLPALTAYAMVVLRKPG